MKGQNSSSIVSAKDIPKVMNFIKSQSNEQMTFTIKPTSKESSAFSKTIDTIPIELSMADLKNIKRLTNGHGKSNYTFQLGSGKNDSSTHFLNLVVREYRDSYYIMIIKYIPEQEWLTNPNNGINTFTGDIVFYNANGEYVGDAQMDNGTSTYSTLSDPCPDGTGSGGGTGGGGSTGGSTGDGGTGGSDGGGSGGGSDYGSCTWEIVTTTCVDHEPGGVCGGTETTLVLNCGDFFDEQKAALYTTAYASFSTTTDPCTLEPNCYDNVGDPCTCNETNDGCLEDPDTIENPDIGVIMTDKEMFLFNNFISSLTLEEQDWINDDANGEINFAIFVYLKENKFSSESKAFADEAINALMNGNSVDFEHGIIINDNLKTNYPCQSDIIKDSYSGSFGDIGSSIETIFANNPNISLTYTNDDLPTTTVGRTTLDFDSTNGNLYNINIKFDNEYLNSATDLSIFATAVHENIHAIIYALLEINSITVADPDGNLSYLAEQYVEYKANYIIANNPNYSGNDMAFLQHQAMTDLVDLMASEIKSYANSKGYTSSNDSVYEALAWEGLQETVAYFGLDSEIKDFYKDLSNYENTGFEILAVGKKCSN